MRLIAVFAVLIGCGGAVAQDRAGAFDYYVLALSWNASWCA
ncbi:MAG: ribonuclease T, partial [Alphaproteobacteria bacterium HGW-Alphaproteobacteria-8]